MEFKKNLRQYRKGNVTSSIVNYRSDKEASWIRACKSVFGLSSENICREDNVLKRF